MNPRKIKEHAGSFLAILALFFLLGLLFIPIHVFADYANLLFSFFLIAVPLFLIVEAYYFIKDIPKRKAALPKKKTRRQKMITAIEWTVLAVFIVVILLLRNGSILEQECPSITQGNPDAELTIKYFFNPLCPSCWKQESVAQDALLKYKDKISLEQYDHRYCQEEGRELGLRMVPGFVFQSGDETELFGSLSKEDISRLICERVECGT